MSEYWKSNPRKFCDFCKCWIADNKPSIEFHERGKRHKESVQKRLAEMGRKGQEDYEARMQEDDFLKAMEEAALKAYKTDIEKNPDLTGTKISEIAKANNAELVVGKKRAPAGDKIEDKKEKDIPKPKAKVWHEAASSDGQSYYWNIETEETKWEAPAEGYLSLAEQKDLKRKSSSANKSNNSANKSNSSANKSNSSANKNNSSADSSSNRSQSTATQDTKVKKQKSSSEAPAPVMTYGPAPRAELYSSWQTIQKAPEQQPVDLQLPQLEEEEYYGPELTFKNSESSFKVKTVTLNQGARDGGNVGFKKRKGAQDNRKIMGRRNDL